MPRLRPDYAPIAPQKRLPNGTALLKAKPARSDANLASLRVGFAFRRSDEDFESFSISHSSFADDQTEQRPEGRIKIGLPLEFIASCLYNAARNPLERLQTVSV